MTNLQTRWRLILGNDVEGLPDPTPQNTALDRALSVVYNSQDASLDHSAPAVTQWLTDIRNLFPNDVVSVIQHDGIERKNLTQLLLEPETLAAVKPDLNIAATLMRLRHNIPDKSKAIARSVIQAVADDINERLQDDLQHAVHATINRNSHNPTARDIDWQRTARKNIKHYDPQARRIIPERIYFYDRTNRRKQWTVILGIDQSGSMAESVIYGSICGSILASMASTKTHVVTFDTAVHNFTELCANDPVDMLLGVQLGGGTDINNCVKHCRQWIENPEETLLILLTDLYEGGNRSQLLAQLEHLHRNGVKVLVMTALSDSGAPAYDEATAKHIAALGIPCFACTPQKLPEILADALR
ncbi:MAG: VWA domain-containing protein [Oscillospiraceae bacterium]|nr:VWA domain-containing protein [Oscillospiraceae bacterium]